MANSIESVLQYLCVVILLMGTLAAAQKTNASHMEYCYARDNVRSQSARFASKTAYSFVKGSESGRQYLVPSECDANLFENPLSHVGLRLVL